MYDIAHVGDGGGGRGRAGGKHGFPSSDPNNKHIHDAGSDCPHTWL